MNAVKLNRMVLTLCGLFSLLVVVIGTTGVAHAVAGAQSSASVTVDPFNDPRTTDQPYDYRGHHHSCRLRLRFIINSTQRSVWEDATVESVITDTSYNNVYRKLQIPPARRSPSSPWHWRKEWAVIRPMPRLSTMSIFRLPRRRRARLRGL